MSIFDKIKDKFTDNKKVATSGTPGPKQASPAPSSSPAISAAGTRGTAAKSGAARAPEPPAVLPGVKNVIAIASGKGGVGKSTTAVSLAYALKERGFKVGLLDADIYGPSIPHMVSLKDAPQARDQVILPPEKDGIKVLSIAIFNDARKPAILRGPMAGAVIKQFLTQADWGELDYLVVDYPPGTGDIQLTISQTINVTGAVVVTTPQEISLLDVRKAIGMFGTTKIPVMGVVETMSYFECICDGKTERHHIFGKGGGELLARESGVGLLAQVPIDPRIAEHCDRGDVPGLMRTSPTFKETFLQAADKVAARCAALAQARGDGLSSFSMEWKPQNSESPPLS